VFENVPGLLNSHDGGDMRAVLECFEDLGYVVDVDILDAQWFGVPQRRRRVFVCGQSVNCLLKERTASSALTIAQCLAESLHLSLIVLSGQSSPAAGSLTFDATGSAASLRKRIRLFGLDSAGQASRLLKSLAALQPWSENGRSILGSANGRNHTGSIGTIKPSNSGEPAKTEDTGEFRNTVMLWNGILAESLTIVSGCITSMPASETIESKIYTCARMALRIAKLIIPSPASCPVFWSAALSSLTALEAFTDYARSASSSLFTDLEWLYPWNDFLREAEPAVQSLRDIGIENFDTVLPLAESLRGDSAPRREAREVAPTIPARSLGDGGLGTGFDCDGGLIASTGEISHCLNAGAMGRIDYETETLLVPTAGMAVRRLTPVEAERLQGVPDGFTQVPYRGRPIADSSRYKMLGNGFAIPVVFWVGKRIEEALETGKRAVL
jgi:site-specific DNA-cytosine methylase